MAEDGHHWKRMCFKTNKVWASVDEQGEYILKNNKVLIKYQKNQPHEYLVFPTALKPENHADCLAPSKKSRKKAPVKKAVPGGTLDEKIPDNAIVVYTDGASSGNPGPAGIGAVLRYGDRKKEISRYIGMETNNIAELEAIRAALSAIKNKDLPVRLHTDSKYAIGVLTLGWKAKANQELIADIQRLLARFSDIRLIKVEGHAGVPDNELADTLATSAIKR